MIHLALVRQKCEKSQTTEAHAPPYNRLSVSAHWNDFKVMLIYLVCDFSHISEASK